MENRLEAQQYNMLIRPTALPVNGKSLYIKHEQLHFMTFQFVVYCLSCKYMKKFDHDRQENDSF